eukprot:s759_g16.t1
MGHALSISDLLKAARPDRWLQHQSESMAQHQAKSCNARTARTDGVASHQPRCHLALFLRRVQHELALDAMHTAHQPVSNPRTKWLRSRMLSEFGADALIRL